VEVPDTFECRCIKPVLHNPKYSNENDSLQLITSGEEEILLATFDLVFKFWIYGVDMKPIILDLLQYYCHVYI
jgi:hypothetical protein